ncbi:MAG: M23 family metallopeptidase [Spirochaetes bacterium]|nr:MAG: M23 family metallopeptidase [Spirochaetota bacterium]
MLLGMIRAIVLGFIQSIASRKKKARVPALIFLCALWVYACPEKTIIPVLGAQPYDWNPYLFWDCPWCTAEEKHKGIDIIKHYGTPVLAATHGLVIYSGSLGKYGEAMLVLSPKLRVHLYGHLSVRRRFHLPVVCRGSVIGAVGNTGTSDCPHLHYTIFSILPHFWLWERENRGWLKMFYLNPHTVLMQGY